MPSCKLLWDVHQVVKAGEVSGTKLFRNYDKGMKLQTQLNQDLSCWKDNDFPIRKKKI